MFHAQEFRLPIHKETGAPTNLSLSKQTTFSDQFHQAMRSVIHTQCVMEQPTTIEQEEREVIRKIDEDLRARKDEEETARRSGRASDRRDAARKSRARARAKMRR